MCRYRISSLATLTLLFVVGCLGPLAQPGPDTAAKQWMEAFAAEDGIKIGKLTCDAQLQTLNNVGALYSAVGILSAQLLSGTKPKVGVDELKYETTRNDGSHADVRVTGRLRFAMGLTSQSQDTDFTMSMVKQSDIWVYCGDLSSAGSPTQTSANTPALGPTSAAPTRVAAPTPLPRVQSPSRTGIVLLRVDLSTIAAQHRRETLDNTAAVLQSRLTAYGVISPSVKIAGSEGFDDQNTWGSLEATVPQLTGEIRQLLSRPGVVEFKRQDQKGNWVPITNQDGSVALTSRLFVKGRQQLLHSGQKNLPEIAFTFDTQGASLFQEATAQLINKPIGIFLDGRQISSPTVQAVLSSDGIITGLSEAEAQIVTAMLNGGALSVTVEFA